MVLPEDNVAIQGTKHVCHSEKRGPGGGTGTGSPHPPFSRIQGTDNNDAGNGNDRQF